jgi:uridine kinase
MKTSFTSKWALILVLGQIAFIFSFVPTLHTELFSPFIQQFLTEPSLDPWQNWIDRGGRIDAFPYGPMMLLYFAIFVIALAPLVGSESTQLGIALGMILVVMCVYILTRKNSSNRNASLFILFSPILFVATFVHGQLDLLPSALLFSGLLFIKRGQWKKAGILLGFASAAKFSALLVLPLIFVFLVRSSRFREKILSFALGLIPGMILTVAPLGFSGYTEMVAKTPQTNALFAYSIKLSSDFAILIAPMIIVLFIAILINLKRANLEVLFIICSVSLSAFPILMPSSPGWFLWGLPGLVFISAGVDKKYQILVFGLGLTQAVNTVLLSSTGQIRHFLNFEDEALSQIGSDSELPIFLKDTIQSFTFLLGILVLWKIFDAAISAADPLKLSTSPLSVAVAGDSGTGKDTICAGISAIFGEKRCSYILGDDYHTFERGASAWGVRTHLNPALSDLDRMTRDSLDILHEKTIWSRHYDHERGRFTKVRKIKSSDVVIINGLHVLQVEAIRNEVDVSVFLDMNNDLRKFLKLKRDTKERNLSPKAVIESLKSRETDREMFIQPQLMLADLVINTSAVGALNLAEFDLASFPELEISATLKDLTFGKALVTMFTSIAGAQATISYSNHPGVTILTFKSIEQVSASDISTIAQYMMKDSEALFDESRCWQSGNLGISQLLIVLSLLEKRKNRSQRLK